MSAQKGNPVPVRLETKEAAAVQRLSEGTGITKADIIRRCIRLSLPDFLSGKANLLDYGKYQGGKSEVLDGRDPQPEEATS